MNSSHSSAQTRDLSSASTDLSDAAVISRSWQMGLATLISRVTGFIRIVLIATILGGALASSFSVANQLPNQIAALVLEATFTAIFIPVLARAEKEDPDAGVGFTRRLVTLSTLILVVTTLLSLLCAPQLVHLMLGADTQVNEPLTVAFSYLLLPQIIGYGLSSVFMAILNTRNIFIIPAWAPVMNNLIGIATLVLYLVSPGELTVHHVCLTNRKLLILGIGTTLGIVAQTLLLLVTVVIKKINISPLWGIDERIKQFATTALAMMLYVFISQIGLMITNQIASSSSPSGPAIYYYCWLLLQFPFGMIGVTILTVLMPRLSRHITAHHRDAAGNDVSLAIRLMMMTLIPIVAIMTAGGDAIGKLLFAYGNFGLADAHYLGSALSLSAFTLIPYGIVLLELRVFYAQNRPWIPIGIIIVITGVKVIVSVLVPHLITNSHLVAGYLGTANGIGFCAGALVGWMLLRRSLHQGSQRSFLRSQTVLTTLVSIVSSLVALGITRLIVMSLSLLGISRLHPVIFLLVLSSVTLVIVGVSLLMIKVPEAHMIIHQLQRLIPFTITRPLRSSHRGLSSHDETSPPATYTYDSHHSSVPNSNSHHNGVR